MNRRTRIAIAATVTVVALSGAGVAAVNASTRDDSDTDTPITGADLQQASAAALSSTGQGRVTGTEVGDEDSYYEIEVTLNNGTQIDVQLDNDFHLVNSKADTDDTDTEHDD